MSHQTGIRANEQLKKFFSKCKDSKIRVFKVTINKEELCLDTFKEAKHSWKEDFDKLVRPMVEDNQPCYILFRLDSKHESTGYNWMLVSWSPDESPIRQKMLYASTKATLKKEFGSAQIKEELHITTSEELSVQEVERARAAAREPAPLTRREEELTEVTAALAHAAVDSRAPGLGAVALPIVPGAGKIIAKLGIDYNYIRLRIDMATERIVLDASTNIEATQLPGLVPEDSARYHIYRYIYFHQAVKHEATIFIYSMPGYSCPIKERMLYSSCKGPLVDMLENEYRITIDKKLEIESGKEVTPAALEEELHPRTGPSGPKFEKPRPPTRGGRRINKPSNQCSLLN